MDLWDDVDGGTGDGIDGECGAEPRYYPAGGGTSTSAAAKTAAEDQFITSLFDSLAADDAEYNLDSAEIAEFEEWLVDMPIERFRQVTQAIEVIRAAHAEFRADRR